MRNIYIYICNTISGFLKKQTKKEKRFKSFFNCKAVGINLLLSFCCNIFYNTDITKIFVMKNLNEFLYYHIKLFLLAISIQKV